MWDWWNVFQERWWGFDNLLKDYLWYLNCSRKGLGNREFIFVDFTSRPTLFENRWIWGFEIWK
jgi:hypothetical protein